MLTLFSYFSLIIILISCLGLYGLSAFSTEQRTREIGIRRVLGGSNADILLLLSKSFLLLVVVAGFISIPIVYYLMGEWLGNFAFSTGLKFSHFFFGFIISVAIAMATVMVQAFKALKKQPVESLKYE